jgi:hypothetical protein
VEVDDTTALIFGDLGVGDTDVSREGLVGQPSLPGQVAAQSDGEAAS